MRSPKYYIIVVFLFLIYFINGAIAIPKLSVTADEGDHLNYGVRIVRGHPEKIRPYDDASTMPVSALNTIPRIYQQVRNPALVKSDGGMSDVFSGRYVTLFFSAGIGLFVLLWAGKLYSRRAGIFSFFLFVFCPNLNGQAVLVTTDSFSALATISTAYYFWQLIQVHSWRNLLLFTLCLAIAQLTKQSLTHLLIIFPAILLIYILWCGKSKLLLKQSFLIKLFVFFLLFLLIINTGFEFNGTGKSLSEYNFRSLFFNRIKTWLYPFGHFPLPFPAPYIEGLDLTKNLDEMGAGRPETSGYIYMFGQYSKTGFWYYYFINILFKTPLPVLFYSFLFCWQRWRHRKDKGISNAEFVIFFTIFYLLIYFNFFYNTQIGIRHIIMIFPLWFVLLGAVADWLYKRKLPAAFLLAYSITTFYYYYPNLIAYTNELLIPKRNAYRIMANTNLDYRQGYYFLQNYLQHHPEVSMAPKERQAGKFIISMNDYLDLFKTGDYNWLRNYKPVAQVCHCYLLFEINRDK